MLVRKYLTGKETENGYILQCDTADVMLVFMTDDILRIRVSFTGEFPESSYALVTTAWEDQLDDVFCRERTQISALQVPCEETEKELSFHTAGMVVKITKEPFTVRVYNQNGELIYSDLSGKSYEKDHLGRVSHYNKIDYEKDHFYGFGEVTGKTDKKGRRFRLSPKDAIGHDPEIGGPLYFHIPFYIRVNEDVKHAVGLFYNNSYDTVFDMGNEIGGYLERYTYYQAEGGDIDLFLINGPTVSEVLERYTYLTGRMAMPTKQSLGYNASTMYYAELDQDCDDRILEVLEKYIRDEIWVDNFQLASGYSSGEEDNLRYVFNWNKRRFKDPEGFVGALEKMGVNIIPNLKPGILEHHPFLKELLEQDAFIKTDSGEEDYIGRWWGGPGRFVDFTGPAGRNAWKKLLKQQILEKGVKTIWNDNCEYDGIDDRNAKCSFEGMGDTMARLKIIQANMMAYCGKEALEEVYPEERPYQINRAGFAGIQRYSQVWGGDNLTDWRTLRFNISELVGMGLSGLANTGCDIGGFTGGAPEAELLLRWIQNGIFQPRFCINSANTDNTVTQPFMYPEILDQVKAAYTLRYRMIPYLYSLMREAHKTGKCVMRPLFMEFPEDKRCYREEDFTFMLGRSLLIANIVEKGATERELYLPAGCDWYDLGDHLRRYEGGQRIAVPVTLDSIPMFLRGDGLVAYSEDIHRVTEDHVKTLKLLVSAEKDQEFIYYDDDGHTKDYETDGYCELAMQVQAGERAEIHFKRSGAYNPGIEELQIRFVSKEKGAYRVRLDEKNLDGFIIKEQWQSAEEGWYYNLSDRTIDVKFQMPKEKEFRLLISREKFDLIGEMNNG